MTKTETSASTLSEQLAPIASRLRENRALIRPVSQVQLRLKPARDGDLFASTVDHILRWMNNRSGRKLPNEAWQRASFELADIGAQRTAAVAISDPRYWSARLDDADKNVPMRTWVTEIGVGLAPDGDVLFGSRLICATRGEDIPFERSVPGFVRSVALGAKPFLDDRPLLLEPVFVDDEPGIEALVDLLEDPLRRNPVIVFGLPEGSNDPRQTAADALRVRQRTLGAAHLFIVSGDASFHLSNHLGRELSVFRQAVRLYRPGFNRWKSDPYAHPLTLPERIRNWEDIGAEAYERWLIWNTLGITAARADRDDALPGFESVRRMASHLQRQAARTAGSTNSELLDLADTELARLEGDLQKQRETYDGLLLASQQELDQAEAARNDAVSRAHALRDRITALEAALKAAGAATPIPDDLRELETWARDHLAGSVTLLSRAYRGAKASLYEDPSFTYHALILLRDHFVPMKRLPGPAAKASFEAECERLKLENSPVGEATRTHSEQYTVQHGGRPRVLDWHLKRGDSRERTRCFRLYYFWDDETQCAVVGWLPSHLDNAMT